MLIKNLIMAGLLVVTALACTKKNNNQKDEQEAKYDLPFEIEVTPTDGAEKSQSEKVSLVNFENKNTIFKDHEEKVKNLVERIKAKKTVSFKEITNLFIDLHSLTAKLNATYNHHSEDTILNSSKISALVSQLVEASKTDGVLSKKSKYEEKLTEINKSEIKYNKDAVSLSQVLSENRQQCYSGTSLNVVVARESSTVESYRKSKNVVIYTSGHILPGKFVNLQKNQYLVGIETTEEGDALKMFYNLNDSYNYAGASSAIRVVDAELFVLYEVIKNYISYAPELLVKKLKDKNIKLDKKFIFQLALQNGCGIIDPIALSIFEKTTQKYGLNKNLIPTSKEDEVSLENCANLIQKKLSDEVAISQKAVRINAELNLSALGFGSSDVAEGDIERSKITSQTLGANITDEDLRALTSPAKSVGTSPGRRFENDLDISSREIDELDSQCQKIRKKSYNSAEGEIKIGPKEKYMYKSFYKFSVNERVHVFSTLTQMVSQGQLYHYYIDDSVGPIIDLRSQSLPIFFQTMNPYQGYSGGFNGYAQNSAEESKYWCVLDFNDDPRYDNFNK